LCLCGRFATVHNRWAGLLATHKECAKKISWIGRAAANCIRRFDRHCLCFPQRMLRHGETHQNGSRDLRIDWLRGLAMTCVVINHSRMTSLLSWFSYERFWIVTAAEVFVVLSGVVLGMVYGRRLRRDGWLAVVKGLGRRALTLYLAFIAVTMSVLLLSIVGVDVRSITSLEGQAPVWWFLDPRTMNAGAWLDVALMRHGPWPFEIVGLYVWLVIAAVPCLMALRFAGWRPLLAVSWVLYVSYRIAPHRLTAAEFESVFPILAWQLLFVHGIVIGYYRERIGTLVARCPTFVPLVTAGASAAFVVFALCNPWLDGPAWLPWRVISAERFSYFYSQYFMLSDLGVGRLLNLAVGLPVGFVLLAWCWRILHPLHVIFVTFGQRSLGAFVLHVYGVLMLAHLPQSSGFWINTLAQVALILAIAIVLSGVQRVWAGRRMRTPAATVSLAA